MSEAAVLAQLSHEEISDKINTFKMPKVYQGQQVYWYLWGDMASDPRPGVVCKIGERAITIRLQTIDQWGMAYASVHHCSDPVLEYRPNIKKNGGCWDYTTHEKDLMSRLEGLEAMIRMASDNCFEGQQLPPEITATDRQKMFAHNNAAKQALQLRCDEAGLEYDRRWGIPKLTELLRNHEERKKDDNQGS